VYIAKISEYWKTGKRREDENVKPGIRIVQNLRNVNAEK
jgi:hypothetical protein